MAVKIGTPRSTEDKAKISLLAVLGSDYGISGYVNDLNYYQGNESIRKAEILAQHMDNKTMGNDLVTLVKKSNEKMESTSRGGFRPGSGRPVTGRKKRFLQATDEEWALILKYADEVRGK